MMLTRVKILGERNTATNYITRQVMHNFDIKILSGGPAYTWEKWFGLSELSMSSYFLISSWSNLGWKHAVPDLSLKAMADCIFIVVVKNPYSWLLSLHKRPYHNWDAQKLSLPEFLAAPWPLMRCDNIKTNSVTPVELWNIKNNAYYEFTQNANTAMLIKYEDILDSPENFVRQLSSFMQLPLKGEIVLPQQGVKSADNHKSFDCYRDYYLNERWKERLTESAIANINNKLDTQLMTKLGYSIITV